MCILKYSIIEQGINTAHVHQIRMYRSVYHTCISIGDTAQAPKKGTRPGCQFNDIKTRNISRTVQLFGTDGGWYILYNSFFCPHGLYIYTYTYIYVYVSHCIPLYLHHNFGLVPYSPYITWLFISYIYIYPIDTIFHWYSHIEDYYIHI